MKAGTVLTCPACSRPQVRTTKDLLPGQKMEDAGFESLEFDMASRLSPRCGECGDMFIRQHPKTGKTQIHTEENGWIPLSKEKPVVK